MTVQKDIFSTNEGRWDFVIAITVMALVGFFIYMVAFRNNSVETSFADNTLEPASAEVIAATEEIADVPVMEESTWEGEEPYRVSTVKRMNPLDGNMQAEASIITDYDVSESTTDVEVERQLSSNGEESEIVEETPSAEIEEVVEEESTIEEVEMPKNEENTELAPIKKEQTPSSDKVAPLKPSSTSSRDGCAIIVGSFKNPRNVERVVDKLEEMGLAIVQGETRPGLNYVGVPVDCAEINQQEELVQRLNRTFDIKAWVKRK